MLVAVRPVLLEKVDIIFGNAEHNDRVRSTAHSSSRDLTYVTCYNKNNKTNKMYKSSLSVSVHTNVLNYLQCH